MSSWYALTSKALLAGGPPSQPSVSSQKKSKPSIVSDEVSLFSTKSGERCRFANRLQGEGLWLGYLFQSFPFPPTKLEMCKTFGDIRSSRPCVRNNSIRNSSVCSWSAALGSLWTGRLSKSRAPMYWWWMLTGFKMRCLEPMWVERWIFRQFEWVIAGCEVSHCVKYTHGAYFLCNISTKSRWACQHNK